jgi:hypothetical protein
MCLFRRFEVSHCHELGRRKFFFMLVPYALAGLDLTTSDRDDATGPYILDTTGALYPGGIRSHDLRQRRCRWTLYPGYHWYPISWRDSISRPQTETMPPGRENKLDSAPWSSHQPRERKVVDSNPCQAVS